MGEIPHLIIFNQSRLAGQVLYIEIDLEFFHCIEEIKRKVELYCQYTTLFPISLYNPHKNYHA